MNIKNFKFNFNSFLTLALFVTLIYGFSNSATTQENEYLTISGEYNRKYQLFHISKKDSNVKKLAIVDLDRNFFQTKFKNRGYEVKVKEITSVYDNRYVFEIISDYEKQGWILKSHGFGVGLADESSNITACQYLMTRIKK